MNPPRSSRPDPARLLLAAGLVLLVLEVALGVVLLGWPEPPFDALPGKQLTDSRAP